MKLMHNAMRGYSIFIVLSLAAILLLAVGFAMPPTGVVDGSVLKAAAVLFGFAALATLMHAVDKGVGAKLEHGDTKLTIDGDDKK